MQKLHINRQRFTIHIEEEASSDFLGRVCWEWEQALKQFETLCIRSAQVRIGIVLSKNFGALPEMLTTKQYFLFL